MLIESNSRTLVAGKTGSGKTYLSRIMLDGIERIVILDTKNSLASWIKPPAPLDRLAYLLKTPERRRIIPPITYDPKWYDRELEKIYRQGNTLLYIDELYALSPSRGNPSKWLEAIYTRGREKNIGVWACTQRPKWIPLYCLSESENFFVFKLLLIDDRRRLAEFIGPSVLNPPPDTYGFYYYNVKSDGPVYMPPAND